jgi:hypothetical protein
VSQCAILFGIPIRKEEYLERLEASDFLRPYRQDPEGQWNTRYERLIAKPLHDLLAKAQAMRLEVCSGATLQDLGEVSKTADVIVLVSHWKNYRFPNDDLIKPITEGKFVEATDRSDDPLAYWLTTAFKRQGIGRDGTDAHSLIEWLRSIQSFWTPDLTLREILEQALDVNIDNESSSMEGLQEDVESELMRRTRRRDVIDGLFSHLLRPGNRLELFDGLHDCLSVAQAIDETFTGKLDLTTCTSTILAGTVGNYHRQRFRIVQFSKNQEPIYAACVLEATLSLMDHGLEYLDARELAIELVRDTAQSEFTPS